MPWSQHVAASPFTCLSPCAVPWATISDLSRNDPELYTHICIPPLLSNLPGDKSYLLPELAAAWIASTFRLQLCRQLCVASSCRAQARENIS